MAHMRRHRFIGQVAEQVRRARSGKGQTRPMLALIDHRDARACKQDIGNIGQMPRHARRAASRTGQEPAILGHAPERPVVHHHPSSRSITV